jgi:alanine-synthesizing transaminase
MSTRYATIKPASRTDHILYAVRDIVVLAEKVAKSGREMLYLNIGDPNKFDFATPPHMIEAVHRAMLANECGYTPSSGIAPARAAIERQAEHQGIRNIQDLFVTTGASEAIEIALTSLAEEGDNVLTPAPGYPLYTAVLAKLKVRENPYYLDEENGWQPDLQDIASKIDDRTRAIVLINPNNPTGSVADRETLLGLLNLARERGLVIFADEIYDKLLYAGEKHISIASLDPDAPVLTFNGLSKSYLAPGWRIGWCIASGEKAAIGPFLEAMNKILRARLCPNAPMQHAIVPALEGPQDHLQEVIGKMERRGELTWRAMNAIPGVSCVRPRAAFYAFPRLDLPGEDLPFVQKLLEATGVVVVHGSGFGQVPGTQHVRIVYLPPEPILEKAYARFAEFFGEYRKN